MGCTRCGTDAQLIELLINKFIKDALADGTLQAGLKDCFAQKLEKSTQVITCHSLEEAVCQLTQDGRICFDKPVMLDYDADAGELVLVMSNGTKLTTPINAKDTFIQQVSFSEADKVVTFRYNDPKKLPLSVDLSVFENPANIEVKENGTVVITNKDGRKSKLEPVKVNAVQGEDGTVTITNQDGTEITIVPNKVTAVKNQNGTATITTQDGEEIIFPVDGVLTSVATKAPIIGDGTAENPISVKTDKSLSTAGGTLGVKPKATGGLEVTPTGLAVKAGDGLAATTDGLKVVVSNGIVTKPDGSIGLKAGDGLTVNSDGTLQLDKSSKQVTNLNLANGGLGISTFYGFVNNTGTGTPAYTVGVPVNWRSEKADQPATSTIEELDGQFGFDFNGWQIATPVQVDQYIAEGNVVWKRQHDSGMHGDGTLKGGNWSNWKRMTAVDVPFEVIQQAFNTAKTALTKATALEDSLINLVDASGTVVLGKTHKTT